ncbi:MAG: AbrB/MazE/SpoVT family DNA-binding domain-containing protein [Alphaproteobacteria bacterium]
MEASHGHAHRYRKRAGHASQRYIEHLGVHPGEKVTVDKLPDGRIEVRAERAAGKISDAFNILKSAKGPSLSIEQMNKIAARGWAGKL